MQPLHRKTADSRDGSSGLEDAQFYPLHASQGAQYSALYRVVPAGRNFFHILEVPSGLIRGFRSGHSQACALAKELEDTLHAINQSNQHAR